MIANLNNIAGGNDRKKAQEAQAVFAKAASIAGVTGGQARKMAPNAFTRKAYWRFSREGRSPSAPAGLGRLGPLGSGL